MAFSDEFKKMNWWSEYVLFIANGIGSRHFILNGSTEYPSCITPIFVLSYTDVVDRTARCTF